MKRPAIAGRLFVRNRGSLHALLCRLQTDRRLHHVVTPFRASLLSRPARESRHGVRYRGASRRPRLFTENTLASFAGVLEMGVDTLELDVGATKDASSFSRMSRRVNRDFARHADSPHWRGRNWPIPRFDSAAGERGRGAGDGLPSERSLELEQGRPQRGLPLLLRQAVQALPMRACVRRSIDGVIASQGGARRCAALPRLRSRRDRRGSACAAPDWKTSARRPARI
jgi:hypothetical protein